MWTCWPVRCMCRGSLSVRLECGAYCKCTRIFWTISDPEIYSTSSLPLRYCRWRSYCVLEMIRQIFHIYLAVQPHVQIAEESFLPDLITLHSYLGWRIFGPYTQIKNSCNSIGQSLAQVPIDPSPFGRIIWLVIPNQRLKEILLSSQIAWVVGWSRGKTAISTKKTKALSRLHQQIQKMKNHEIYIVLYLSRALYWLALQSHS